MGAPCGCRHRQVALDLERGWAYACFWQRQPGDIAECEAFRHHVIWWNVFNFNDVVFSARFIETKQRTYVVVTDLGHCAGLLFFTFLWMHVFSRQVCVVLLFLTNRHVKMGPGRLVASPHLINLNFIQPNSHKMHYVQHEKVLQVECLHENLTLCQVSDTKSPLFDRIWKFIGANLQCSASAIWAQLVLISPACLRNCVHCTVREFHRIYLLHACDTY